MEHKNAQKRREQAHDQVRNQLPRFYVGANVGGACASDTVTQSNLAGPFPNTGKINSSGIVGGGQFGYNWVVAPNWLLGVEADVYTCVSTSATSPSVS